MEQGQVLDAATALGGRAIACLRISYADERPRHRGLSHHDITALTIAARERATVVLPDLDQAKKREVRSQVEAAELHLRHDITTADGAAGVDLLEAKGLRLRSMGRDLTEVRELFTAAAAAGDVAARYL
jgi:hypothetical protein